MKKKHQRIIQKPHDKLNNPQADHDEKIISQTPPETCFVKKYAGCQRCTVKNNLEKRGLCVTGKSCIQKKNAQEGETAQKGPFYRKTCCKRPAEKENHGCRIAKMCEQVDESVQLGCGSGKCG
ncbi:hypothetical protein [Eubacterium sp. An11]|uniref:hypothetical protein n=1 Tax=Eubacterium sp. An11 TaxID=1965542 RepID=UPI0013A600EF|nr:hypothetical protein [Eubacterium sp. An11]